MSDVRRSFVLIAGLLTAIAVVAWAHSRGETSAEASWKSRVDTWSKCLAREPDNTSERTANRFNSIAGVVLDFAEEPVSAAAVVLVDLTKLEQVAGECGLNTAVPEACVEARTVSDSNGGYVFKGVSIGPKAVLAATERAVSTPRWLCRVLDGVPVHAFDLRISPWQPLVLKSAVPGSSRSLRCCAVFDEQYSVPTPTTTALDGQIVVLVPRGVRPDKVLITDVETLTAKVFAVDYGADGSGSVRHEFRMADVMGLGLVDGSYVCEVDDLDFGIVDVCAVKADVVGGALRIPFLGGRVGVTVRGESGTCYARLAGQGGEIEVKDLRRLSVSRGAQGVEVHTLLAQDGCVHAEVLVDSHVPLVGSGDSRLDLMRHGARRSISCTNSEVTVDWETACRFPILQLTTRSGAIQRSVLAIDEERITTSVGRRWAGGSVEVTVPWAYSLARLTTDEGSTYIGRAGRSSTVTFDQVSRGVPFVIQVDDGAFGWNKYALEGGVLEGRVLRVSVPRSTERPKVSSRCEICGFLVGDTDADRVIVICQPLDNPRSGRRRVCEGSPFFDFVVDPHRGYVVVAMPQKESRRGSVEYMKSIAYQSALVPGEIRRLDLNLHPGRVTVMENDALLEGRTLGLLRVATGVDEAARQIWSWKYRRGYELRNVPLGQYEVATIDTEGAALRLVSREFQVQEEGVAEVRFDSR